MHEKATLEAEYTMDNSERIDCLLCDGTDMETTYTC